MKDDPAADRAARRARKAKTQARWRHNAGNGSMVCPVLVTSTVLDWLIDDIHWVAEARSGDRFEVGKCIAAGLEEAARRSQAE